MDVKDLCHFGILEALEAGGLAAVPLKLKLSAPVGVSV